MLRGWRHGFGAAGSAPRVRRHGFGATGSMPFGFDVLGLDPTSGFLAASGLELVPLVLVRWFWSVGFALGLGGPYDALLLSPSGKGEF